MIYTKWSKVITWVREDFPAESDEEAIQLSESGDYERYIMEFSDDYYEFSYQENDNSPTEEIYNEDGDLIWNNEPLQVKRDNKIDSILSKKTHF